MSAPFSSSKSLNQSLSLSKFTSPSTWMPTDVTVESCWCSLSSSRKVGSISITLLRSKAPTPRIRSGATLDCEVSMISANALMLRSFASTVAFIFPLTRSTLFRRILSANATCSTDSFSTPSGFFSSRWARICFASTTVIIASSTAFCLIFSSMKNVCATGAGSASPVVSINIASNLSLRLSNLCIMRMRSPRTVQQMHPLFISMISSFVSITRPSSTPISPNSFSMTAIFFPCFAVRM
mmetsp:Transcript_48631/g.93009  ORF Transcript_48631/g.93009 Transcript_48631/m.93009 type:complete len:239 (-) Transcript_48631:103-819(-)